MKKIFLIGLKDLKMMFRDRAALILMLVAPFALTIGLGLATGQMSASSDSGVSDIPLIIVNQDGGELGDALVSVFQSDELSGLVKPTLADDFDAARREVDEDNVAAAILIPAGFSGSIIPQEGQPYSDEVVELVLYTNPLAPTSVGIIRSIVDNFLSQVETAKAGGTVIIGQMVTEGLIQPEQAQAAGEAYGQALTAVGGSSSSISIQSLTGEGSDNEVSPLAMLAPGMALMFLMFTVSNGGRSLLVERNHGTLARLAVSPTRVSQLLAGKMFGIYLTGVVQMVILIAASSLLYRLSWGDPLGMAVLILAAVFGATGWGLLLCAFANTPGQVSSIGSALMLTFGILGGSFFSLNNLPDWAQWVAHISPNAWGMDGFTTLALGGDLANLGRPILGLLVMGVVLFVVSAFLINRRGLIRA
jgi:ABC-2 type transport system permease protein